MGFSEIPLFKLKTVSAYIPGEKGKERTHFPSTAVRCVKAQKGVKEGVAQRNERNLTGALSFSNISWVNS